MVELKHGICVHAHRSSRTSGIPDGSVITEIKMLLDGQVPDLPVAKPLLNYADLETKGLPMLN